MKRRKRGSEKVGDVPLGKPPHKQKIQPYPSGALGSTLEKKNRTEKPKKRPALDIKGEQESTLQRTHADLTNEKRSAS